MKLLTLKVSRPCNFEEQLLCKMLSCFCSLIR